MAKKTVHKKALVANSSNHLTTTRSILYLLIIMLAGSVFFLFKTYQNNIIANNMFAPFMGLTVIAMALLISLLFLVNPAKTKKK